MSPRSERDQIWSPAYTAGKAWRNRQPGKKFTEDALHQAAQTYSKNRKFNDRDKEQIAYEGFTDGANLTVG